MQLSETQQKKALEKLTYFFSKSCDSCSGHDWLLNDKVFEMREFNMGTLVLGGQASVFPVITVSCKQCGNTYLFNAILLGLIEKKDDIAG